MASSILKSRKHPCSNHPLTLHSPHKDTVQRTKNIWRSVLQSKSIFSVLMSISSVSWLKLFLSFLLLHKTQWSFGLKSKFLISGSIHHVPVRRTKGERVVSTVRQGGGGVMTWRCLVGDTIGDLFKIQVRFSQYGSHRIMHGYAFSTGLHLVGPSFVFQKHDLT